MLEIIKKKLQEYTSKKTFAALIFIFTISFILRFRASFDLLWMDEIWSLGISKLSTNFIDIFSVHHDNNHILNTVYLHFFGHGTWWPLYRMHSIIAGTLTVILLTLFSIRKNFKEGIIVGILSSLSFSLISYSTEARGYAMATLFGFISFLVIQKYGKNAKPYQIVIFWISSILGLLSHPVFIYFIFVFFVTSVFANGYKIKNIMQQIQEVAVWNILPILSVAIFFITWKNAKFGGAPPPPVFFENFSQFMFLITAAKDTLINNTINILTYASITFWLCKNRKKFDWLSNFYLIMVVIIPIGIFLIPFPVFYTRYLILALPFFFIVLSKMLAEGMDKRGAFRIISIAFIFFFIYSNLSLYKKNLQYGRGDYVSAIKYIVDSDEDDVVMLGSDHDSRNYLILNFYIPLIKLDKKIQYIKRENITKETAPDWLILHDLQTPPIPEQKIHHFETDYTLQKTFFRSNPFSGFTWFIYKKS